MSKKLGWIGALAVMLGLNIGGALWSKPVVAASIGGPGTAVVTVLGMGVVVLAAPGYLALTKAWSVSPGHYYYNSRLLLPENKRVGHFIGWSVIFPKIVLAGFVVLQILVIAGASYLHGFFPAISTQVFTIGLLLLTVSTVWFGMQTVGRIEIVFAVFLILSIGMILGLGFLNIDPENLTPVFPAGLLSTLSIMGVMLTTFITGLFVIDFGDDIEDPESKFGKILLINSGAAALIGTGVILVTVGMVPYDQLANQTLRIATSQYLSPQLVVVSTVAAMIAGITSNIAIISYVVRYIKATAKDGILPKWLSKENKYGEPKYVLMILGVISIVGVLLDIPLNAMIQAGSLGNLCLLTVTSLTASRLPSTRPEIFENGPLAESKYLTPGLIRWVPKVAAVVFGVFVVAIALNSPTGIRWYLLILLVGITIYMVQKVRGKVRIGSYDTRKTMSTSDDD